MGHSVNSQRKTVDIIFTTEESRMQTERNFIAILWYPYSMQHVFIMNCCSAFIVDVLYRPIWAN